MSADVDELWMKAKECAVGVGGGVGDGDGGGGGTPPSSPQDGVPAQRFDVEKMHRERAEQEECLRALRERDIPPYFDSDVAACLLKKQEKQVRTQWCRSVAK